MNHLKDVDGNRRRVRVLCQKIFQLFLQSMLQQSGLSAEADSVGSVLGDLEQPVLDTELRIFKTEIADEAGFRSHSPGRITLGYSHCQPEGQPGLSHLGRARQDVESSGEQRVHNEVERSKRLGHERGAIDGVETVSLDHRIPPSFYRFLAGRPSCVRIQEKEKFQHEKVIFTVLSKNHFEAEEGRTMKKNFGLYVTLLPKGKIKRDLTGSADKVSLEDTTIQDELILFSELSFRPYAQVVDMLRASATFLCLDNGTRPPPGLINPNVYSLSWKPWPTWSAH